MKKTVFLFGEAEKGEFCIPHLLRTLPQLADTYGNPPPETLGILYAVQALMYERELIYFRVQEEGFSVSDYMRGMKLLEDRQLAAPLTAICMPGVGDTEIIEASSQLCKRHRSFLIISEKDLYDYLMN